MVGVVRLTKFDLGDKVYFDIPDTQWGWVESIRLSVSTSPMRLGCPTGVFTIKSNNH